MLIVLNSRNDPFPETQNKAAIVTIAIGERFVANWQRLSLDAAVNYGVKYGFDVVLITYHLDDSEYGMKRSASWQRLLVLDQPWSDRYDRIVWTDADVVIHPSAPNILEYSGEPWQVSLTGTRMSAAEKQIYIERLWGTFVHPDQGDRIWDLHHEQYFSMCGITQTHNQMFNSGVMVLSPGHHNDMMKECYFADGVESRLYEQPLLCHAIAERKLARPISPRFNWGVYETLFLYFPNHVREKLPEDVPLKLVKYLVRRDFDNAYFFHFYGTPLIMELMSHDDLFGDQEPF
jgi:hypothetical protein